jgi:hypothetical protein
LLWVAEMAWKQLLRVTLILGLLATKLMLLLLLRL